MRRVLKIAVNCLILGAIGCYLLFAFVHAIDAEEQLNERNRARQLDNIGSVQEHSQRVANMIAGDR